MYMYAHKLHLAVSQPDARNTRHFSSGIIFTKRRSLARQSPTLVRCVYVYVYIYIYTYICTLVMPFPRAASAVSSAVCTRALLISSKYETSKTIVPSTIPLSPFALSVSPRQPGGEKSRGIFKFRGRSPSFCPPSLLRYISFTLLLRPRFILVPWKIGMARDNYKKIFFRVKVKGGRGEVFFYPEKSFNHVGYGVDCNWSCSSLI